MDLFSAISYGVLVLLMALSAWWAIASFKASRWIGFVFALAIFVFLGFAWQFFPAMVFLLLAPIFGWSFS